MRMSSCHAVCLGQTARQDSRESLRTWIWGLTERSTVATKLKNSSKAATLLSEFKTASFFFATFFPAMSLSVRTHEASCFTGQNRNTIIIMKRIQVILASIIATTALTLTVSAQQGDGQGKGQGKGKGGCKKEECIGQKGKKGCKGQKAKADCGKKCDGTGAKSKKGGGQAAE